MATVILQAAGAAIGGVFGPAGAMAGRALGALAGAAIDRSLFGAGSGEGTHLSSARFPGPEEGTAIPRVYGTARIGGTLIWATRFLEQVVEERSGGKGSTTSTTVRTEYSYSVSMALGLCEGPIAGVRRVFADGRELALDSFEMRVYPGTASQPPDPLIVAKQGGGAPAYRGLAYVVLENFPLHGFGNRIPLLQFEVIRPIGRLERDIRAVTVIPGATEHGYNPVTVTERLGGGASRQLNRNTLSGRTDWLTSIDELTALCPNLETVALTVSWFGTSLDLAGCRILPGVEVPERSGETSPWSVSGLARGEALLLSRSGGGPAFGGTPSDASVISAIRDLKRRGLKVVLYPFLLMDVPPGNGLADPEGGASQPAYPWRGRITCNPAPGRPGSPDGTAAARALVDAFCGNTGMTQFALAREGVNYTGSGFGFRRMILHMAWLARVAGGVDGFLLSSELRGLTTLRDGEGRFPFVEQLLRLADEVKQILGWATRVTYGADWSEYFGYQPPDGSGNVYFHLDPLWASDRIDAVGIDNYLPLSDCRSEDFAAGNPDGFAHADDPAALERGITSGERFDWYYASDADRAARRRQPIADGAAGKRWVFAPKDIAGWWSNLHYERRGGREVSTPTAWRPGLKPVWFTELGAPAIDRGANEPNLFLDPKSSESRMPAFSRGHRADSAQRAFLDAHYRHWSGPNAPPGMVSPSNIFLWCWDARPFPAFPFGPVWSDGDNWRTGHWLNGRLGAGTLASVIAALLADHGFTDVDVTGVSGDLPGYVQADILSARSLLEPLIDAFGLDVTETAGRLVFRSRAEASRMPVALAALAEEEGEPLVSELRGEAAALPAETLLAYADQAGDFQPARARATSLSGEGSGAASITLPAVLDSGLAERLAAAHLRDRATSRRTLRFRLAASALAVEPGDLVTLPEGPAGRFLVTRIEEGRTRLVEARSFSPAPGAARALAPVSARPPRLPPGTGFDPDIVFIDLPRMGSGAEGSFFHAAAAVTPWRPMGLALGLSAGTLSARARLDRPAMIGRLGEALSPGTVFGRFDRTRTLTVEFPFGAPASAARSDVLAGANRIAVLTPGGTAEIIGFLTAEEVAPRRFRLAGLISGLNGTEDLARQGAPSGSRAVLLGPATVSLSLAEGEIGRTVQVRLSGSGALGGTAGPFEASGGLRAERPLAPVHLAARRLPDGTVLIRWIRRGRIDADGWEATDIPLDEPELRFRVEIAGTDGVLRRSLTVTATEARYAPAEQEADFATRPTALDVTIRQIGRRVADGIPATARLFP